MSGGDASFASGADGETRSARAYLVVARRYRPQAFAELIGQQRIAAALSHAIETHRVGHAYLFTGARGVGKTSAARIFAKALNCLQGMSVAPCHQCDVCQGVARGDDMDVLEIDGASNRGIDEIRQLRANVHVRPSRARMKIYIIDEVHMLTKEAFNALLKTLEEPPSHVKFIFCTTDPEKVPITVLSRCQRFDFAPVEIADLVDRLQQIVLAEGATAEPEALHLLARRAAGSVRDSQSLLERMLAVGGSTISVEQVHQLMGTAKSTRLVAMTHHLCDRDAAGALSELDAALAEGVEVGQLAEQLVGQLRDLLAVAVGCRPEQMLFHELSEYPTLQELADRWGLETMLAAVQILDQTLMRMRQSLHSRTLLEVALVRMARLEHLDQLPTWISQFQGHSRGALPSASAAASSGKSAPVARIASPSRPDRGAGGSETVAAKEEPAQTPEKKKPAEVIRDPAAEPALTPANLTRIWRQALSELNDMTADCAQRCDRVTLRPPHFIVAAFQPKYNSSMAYCERPEPRGRLEEALSRAAGQPVRVDFQLLAPATTTSTDARGSTPQERLRTARSHPFVQLAVELYEAELTQVEAPARTEASNANSPATPGEA